MNEVACPLPARTVRRPRTPPSQSQRPLTGVNPMNDLYDHIVHAGPPPLVLESIYTTLRGLADEPENERRIAYAIIDDDCNEYRFGFWDLEQALAVIDDPDFAEQRRTLNGRPRRGHFWCVTVCKQHGVLVLGLPLPRPSLDAPRARIPAINALGGVC